MDKKTIAVIFGGCSPEYPVSLESSHSVVVSFDREKYELILLGITKGGEWFRYYGGPEGIENDTWREGKCVPAVISPDREVHGVVEFGPDGPVTTRIDAAFPVMHGKNGEDGTIQGLCEMAGIPTIGCGALCSALCMDKDRAHKLVSLAGVEVPRAVVFTSMPDEAELRAKVEEIGYPVFVKPVRAGSSFGITKVSGSAALMDAVRFAFRYDREVIIEETIVGNEVGCAVMGNEELTIGRADEIEIFGDIFDYEEKYTLKTAKIHMPARVDEATEARIKAAAEKIYRALGCRVMARVDMFLTKDGRVVFNEVNTIPGFTPHSRFPNMMKGIGLDFTQLLDCLVGYTFEQ